MDFLKKLKNKIKIILSGKEKELEKEIKEEEKTVELFREKYPGKNLKKKRK